MTAFLTKKIGEEIKMPNTIKMTQAVTLTEEESNRVSRLLETAVSHAPTSFESGLISIAGGIENELIATNVKFFVMKATPGASVSIKVGDTTSTEMKNITAFTYDGGTTSIYISNTGTDPVEIQFAQAKY